MKRARGSIRTRMDVVIVNFNAREHLRACLASVEREAPSETVVVDSSSTDGSAAMVAAEYGWARLVRCPNRGYGAAANRGIAETSADYVLLLNSDTVLHPGTVSALSAYLDAHPAVGVAGPRLVNPDGSLQPSCYPFLPPLEALKARTFFNVPWDPTSGVARLWPHDRARSVPWVKGAALAIRRSAFAGVGGFDESYFMYFEELDLAQRLQAANWKIDFTPSATVVHEGGASTLQQHAAMTVELFASLLRFYGRHYSKGRFFVLRLLIATVMLARLVRDGIRLRRVSDTLRRSALEEDMSVWRKTLLDSLASGKRAVAPSHDGPL